MIQLVVRVLAEAYEILSRDRRVISPGSIRSFIAAAKDVVTRLQLCDYSCDATEIITRVAVQELAHVVRTVDGSYETAVTVVREAIEAALNGLGPRHVDEDVLDALAFQSQDQSRDSQVLDSLARKIVVGDVGDERVPNLATLINEKVGEWAHITAKVSALRELGIPRRPIEVDKRLLASRRRLIRVEKFEQSRTPIAPIITREWRLGDQHIDVFKSAINIRRRLARGLRPSHRDLIVDEFGEPEPPDIVIGLDVSASMNEMSVGGSKLDVAKRHIAAILASVRTRIGMVLFNARSDVLWVPTDTARYLNHMIELLSAVYADGGTDIGSALLKIGEVVKHVKRRVAAVLVSDGKTMSLEKALSAARRLATHRVFIISVAVGRDADTQLLRKLASMTGGALVVIRDISDLAYAIKTTLSHIV